MINTTNPLSNSDDEKLHTYVYVTPYNMKPHVAKAMYKKHKGTSVLQWLGFELKQVTITRSRPVWHSIESEAREERE